MLMQKPLFLIGKGAKLENSQNYPLSIKDSNKCNSKPTQLQTIFHFLQRHVATASMVSDVTGVPQKNICRFKRDLEKTGCLWEIEKKPCKKTGYKAWYITTNPENAPKNLTQLRLF
jgi:hypothetical protein